MPRLAAAFERGFAFSAQRGLLALQALALVASGLRIGAEARHVVGAGAAHSLRPHPAHAESSAAGHEAKPVTHAENMAGAAAMRLLRPAGGQGHGEREQERPKNVSLKMQLPDSLRSPAILPP
jgi:hypothetical protein